MESPDGVGRPHRNARVGRRDHTGTHQGFVDHDRTRSGPRHKNLRMAFTNHDRNVLVTFDPVVKSPHRRRRWTTTPPSPARWLSGPIWCEDPPYGLTKLQRCFSCGTAMAWTATAPRRVQWGTGLAGRRRREFRERPESVRHARYLKTSFAVAWSPRLSAKRFGLSRPNRNESGRVEGLSRLPTLAPLTRISGARGRVRSDGLHASSTLSPKARVVPTRAFFFSEESPAAGLPIC